jgi:hypothetical protein
MYIVCVCVYSTHLDANCCTAAEPVHKCETVPAEFSYPPCNEVNYALSLSMCFSRPNNNYETQSHIRYSPEVQMI